MKISIIIPTLDRHDELKVLIHRLCTIPCEYFELVVVDDSISRLSDDFISIFGIKLIYIHRGQKLGVSSARNIGSESATGDYFIFLDDDDEVTDSWLLDFASTLLYYPDLVYCNMQIVQPNGKISSISASRNNGGIVIPGAWMIRKEAFEKIGGYDERLKFAENTELFFRLNQLDLSKRYVEKENFIYRQSPDGGSKNLQNMLDSIRIILEKHDDYLTAHVKHLYHQNIGVIEMRFGNFKIARQHLWKSWKYKPQKISTPIRILLAYFPFVARRIYTANVQNS